MYYADIVYSDPITGEKTRTTKGTGFKATEINMISAYLKVAELKEEYQRITNRDPSEILFSEYMVKWLDYIKNYVKSNTR